MKVGGNVMKAKNGQQVQVYLFSTGKRYFGKVISTADYNDNNTYEVNIRKADKRHDTIYTRKSGMSVLLSKEEFEEMIKEDRR